MSDQSTPTSADSSTVLVLVHDADARRGRAEIGTVLPALEHAGLDVLVGTTVGSSELVTDLPDPQDLRAVVVMGSEAAAYDDAVPWLARELAYVHRAVEVGTPVLGICFGGQLLARALGGSVRRGRAPEQGFVTIDVDAPRQIPAGPWMEFHDDVLTPPPSAVILARNRPGGLPGEVVQAFRQGRHLGVQFHPEITPPVFEAWIESWEAAGQLDDLAAAGVDIEALRAEIAERAPVTEAACRELVAGFLSRSTVPSTRDT